MFGAFLFPSHCRWWSLPFLEMAEHVPPWKVVNEFLVLLYLCVTFAFPIKQSLSQPSNFLSFVLPVLSPIPKGWRVSELSEWASDWRSGAWLMADILWNAVKHKAVKFTVCRTYQANNSEIHQFTASSIWFGNYSVKKFCECFFFPMDCG